ncbi:hypothetical protein BOTNAR_0484g00020 [Botryotinia narcissicola]|uniref:F-box domain-containing protein n=1 Tax=Botryotinia narcissicola TaxID=278944 RepID=A0A4Z1HHH1_9HELO|nr:hypothetical protein BOTNAR_0484g00020 [Botryotinia narcissicola]
MGRITQTTQSDSVVMTGKKTNAQTNEVAIAEKKSTAHNNVLTYKQRKSTSPALLGIPAEIIKMIAELLPGKNAACLILCSRSMKEILGDRPSSPFEIHFAQVYLAAKQHRAGIDLGFPLEAFRHQEVIHSRFWNVTTLLSFDARWINLGAGLDPKDHKWQSHISRKGLFRTHPVVSIKEAFEDQEGLALEEFTSGNEKLLREWRNQASN